MTAPLATGDSVLLHLNGTAHTGVIRAVASWEWLLIEGPSGRLYLDVMISQSAVSWSRLVLLKAYVTAADLSVIHSIAVRIANRPSRKDARDVAQVEALLPAQDRVERA